MTYGYQVCSMAHKGSAHDQEGISKAVIDSPDIVEIIARYAREVLSERRS